ncbi:MAG: FkbM family methyltransferase [Croceibacterium sp.]
MSTLGSIFRALPVANHGKGLADKAAIFLVIAFETTSFSNPTRRVRIKRALRALSRDGLVTIHFAHGGENFAVNLRAGEDGDISVASEFLRSGYEFPDVRPSQIIDGGANIGFFSILASRRYPEVRISCFEANPDNIAALERNLAINGANAEVINKALWSGDSELVFHSHLAYSGHVAEVGAEPEATGAVRVPAVLPEIGRNCWLKLDIEGAEYEVLPALIAAGRLPRWISAELHHYRKKGPALVELLQQGGYRMSGVPEQPMSDEIVIFAERAAS